MSHYVIVKKTGSDKLYMKAHRRTSASISGIEVVLDADVKKALLFGNEKKAKERAQELSSDLTTYTVELTTPSAKVGDMVDEPSEAPVAALK